MKRLLLAPTAALLALLIATSALAYTEAEAIAKINEAIDKGDMADDLRAVVYAYWSETYVGDDGYNELWDGYYNWLKPRAGENEDLEADLNTACSKMENASNIIDDYGDYQAAIGDTFLGMAVTQLGLSNFNLAWTYANTSLNYYNSAISYYEAADDELDLAWEYIDDGWDEYDFDLIALYLYDDGVVESKNTQEISDFNVACSDRVTVLGSYNSTNSYYVNYWEPLYGDEWPTLSAQIATLLGTASTNLADAAAYQGWSYDFLEDADIAIEGADTWAGLGEYESAVMLLEDAYDGTEDSYLKSADESTSTSASKTATAAQAVLDAQGLMW